MLSLNLVRVLPTKSSPRALAALSSSWRGSSSLAFAAVVFAAGIATAADAPKNPNDLLRDLWNVARDKNAALEAVSNAYAAVTSVTNLNSNQRGDATRNFVNAHFSRGFREEGLALARGLSTASEIPVGVRADILSSAARSFADANKRDAFGAYHNDGMLKAGEIYAEILAIPDATPAEKVAAYRDMAEMRLEADRDVPGAFALLDKAIALPGIAPDQKARAIFGKADLHRRVAEYDKALALLAPIAADGSLPDNVRRDALGRSFSVAGAQGGLEAELKARREAMAKYKDSKGDPLLSEDDLARFCSENGVDTAFAISYYRRGLVDMKPKGRFPHVARLCGACKAAGFDTFAKEIAFAVQTANRFAPDQLKNIWSNVTGRPADKDAAVKDARYPRFLLETFSSVDATNRLSAADIFNYASKHRDCDDFALKAAREIVKLPADDKSANADTRKNAAVAVALADANGNPGRAVALLNDWLKKNPPKDNLERAEFLLRGVKRALILRQEEASRAIYAERAKLVRKEEPRSLPCPFVENAPQDISEILRADFYKKAPKGLADRKFGDDLKFIIETDVTMGRSLTEFNGKPFRPTEVFAFCDQHGVKVMLRQFCDAETLRKFSDGFGGISGYEAYIAPGVDGPYTFLGFGPGATKIDSSFLTQYDNGTGYRNLKSADDSILLSNYVANDSVISLLSFAWSKEFANLPSNGDKWYFEPLCWANGGWSWGGSKGVHNRSSFGALVFEGITPKAAAAIRRVILKKAADAYWNAKSARTNGYAESWKDPELGDPAFYDECVAPVLKRLDAYAARIKADMADEEVMDVYENAAADMLNINFILSRLRTRYLTSLRIAEGQL